MPCRLHDMQQGRKPSAMASKREPKRDEGESFLEGKLLIAMPGMSDDASRRR